MDSSTIDAPDLPSAAERRAAWARALAEIDAILGGDSHHSATGADGGGGLDAVAAMATAASVLHGHLPYSSWTGFYRVVAPGLLSVGPYQGGVGCLEIPFDRGVCGAAARDAAVQLVPDVHAFPGHIACDASTRSELVVPVFGGDGASRGVVAVLDLDSPLPDAFDEIDVAGAEAVAERVGRTF
jgi:GAF domain-containing protein